MQVTSERQYCLGFLEQRQYVLLNSQFPETGCGIFREDVLSSINLRASEKKARLR